MVFLLALAVPVGAPSAQAAGPESGLDSRQWELVSPAEKNGGDVAPAGGENAGVLQAAAAGGAIAYASAASFADPLGAAPFSQYLATRGAAGWSTANLTPPLLSGTYAGGAYQLFSPDLTRAILGSGWRCRDGGGEACVAENPPLAAGAPAGYRNLYLREDGANRPLITTANAPALALEPEDFHLELSGASPDLRHAVISTCAALTADAVEVPDGGGGCEAAATNLYQWSDGGLAAVNIPVAGSETEPGAAPAAPAAAVSADGSRIYWRDAAGNLNLRSGSATTRVDADAGGGGTFATASSDGGVAYFTVAGHLWRFLAAGSAATDITPGLGVLGVLGASEDGSHVYYLAADGLYHWQNGATNKVAAAADSSNLPAATGTARVSPDGSRLAFLSSASLTGYDNRDPFTDLPYSEVFVYDAAAAKLICASCNPKGSRPKGPASIPGALAAGEGGPAAYKPRALSADGSRLFFDSGDSLVLADTDQAPDVYQWVAKGTAGCVKAVGCVGLISGGRSGSAGFADAAADGSDAFFLATASLLPADPGAVDLYDARPGGGFAEPQPPIPCIGDACQGPAPAPDDPTPGTASDFGAGNLPPKVVKKPCRRHRGKHCKRPHRKHSHRRGGRGR